MWTIERLSQHLPVYRHCMSTTVTLSFDNGLQLNPNIVHVDFELAAMMVYVT